MINVIVLHTHPIEDGRIKRHIQYLLDKNITLFHIHVNLSEPSLRQGTFPYLNKTAYRINLIGSRSTISNLLYIYPHLFRNSFFSNILQGLETLNFTPDFPTIIHVHDPTLLMVAKRLRKYLSNETKIVYDRHELFEKMHNQLGFGFYQVFEITSKKSVSGLVLVAEGHASSAKKLFPNAIMATIPNYPSEHDYTNLQIQKKLEPSNLQKEIQFVYVGSLRTDLDRDIDLLLDIAETLLGRYNHTSFYIAGHCYDVILRERLFSLVHLYPERFHYLGFIERKKAIEITQEAHFGFFLIRPDSHYWVKCSPNKVFEYLKCGVIPIIRADVENADQFAEASLIFSRNSSYDEIIEEIIKVIENPAKLVELIQNGQHLSTKFTWETVATRYLDLYGKLIQN